MKPPTGWASLILLALLVLTVVAAIQALEWTPGLEILTPVVLCAVAVGAVLANRMWLPALLAHGWSLVFGLAAIAFFGTFILADYGVARSVAEAGIVARVTAVRDMFFDWLRAVMADEPVDEETARFVFVLWMATLLWLVSYMAAWFLVRYVNWWGIVLPSGFALLATLYSAPPRFVVYMAAFLLFSLVLAGQTNAALQIDRWHRDRIPHSPDIHLGFLRDGLIVAVAVVALGFLVPAQSSPAALRSWAARLQSGSRQVNQQFGRLFPNLNVPATGVRGGGQAFGRDLPLGGSISLGTSPVFDARVEPPFDVRYWRMAVYDEYTGSAWRRSETEQVVGQVMERPENEAAGAVVTQTVTVLAGGARQLYAIPRPFDFDVPVVTEVASWSGQATTDLQSVESATSLAVGDAYTVRSHVGATDADGLRRATATDPDSIVARYLSIPPSTTQRTLELAARTAMGAGTRFDQAASIEAFLRTIPYSATINPPPAGRDLVDWFLFDEQRGYCDYYASAFVVMARSLGIPSRLAAGYAAGDYLPETGTYRQLESNAHSWPEVYFPERGWVPFEPTANQPGLTRSVPIPASAGSEPDIAPPQDERGRFLPDDGSTPGAAPSQVAAGSGGLPRVRRTALALAAILAIAVAIVATAVYGLWARAYRGLTVAEASFARLTRVAAWLGMAPAPADTPHEYGLRLGTAVPDGRDDILTITDAYVGGRFGRRSDEARGPQLAAAWRHLRGQFARVAPRLGLARVWRGSRRRTKPPGPHLA